MGFNSGFKGLIGFKDSVNLHNVNPEVLFHAAFIHKFITAR